MVYRCGSEMSNWMNCKLDSEVFVCLVDFKLCNIMYAPIFFNLGNKDLCLRQFQTCDITLGNFFEVR